MSINMSKVAVSLIGKIRLRCEALEARNAPCDILGGIAAFAYGEASPVGISDDANASETPYTSEDSAPAFLDYEQVALADVSAPVVTVSADDSGSADQLDTGFHGTSLGDIGSLNGVAVQPPVAGSGPISALPISETTPVVGVSSGDTNTGLAGEAISPLFRHQSRPQTISGLSPSKLRTAYGFSALPTGDEGAGVTIAIVDAYNAANITSDLQTFDTEFSLQQFNVAGGPTFKVVNETGGTKLPANNSGWAGEIALDVEWAHAAAPLANITLVEASTAGTTDLYKAVDYAGANAQVVSMSWSGGESSSELGLDTHFEHSGVSFVASSGDDGTGVGSPASSPYVVGVGGTTLNLSSTGAYTSETAWYGSGGGISHYESEPAYQTTFGVTGTSGKRGVPDVSFDANPNTGVAVYSSPNGGWEQVGGTSLGSPSIAGLIADVDGARHAAGRAYLTTDSTSKSFFYAAAATPALYAANFHDITSGSNGTGSVATAHAGYDFVTGIGSPNAANLIPWLIAY